MSAQIIDLAEHRRRLDAKNANVRALRPKLRVTRAAPANDFAAALFVAMLGERQH